MVPEQPCASSVAGDSGRRQVDRGRVGLQDTFTGHVELFEAGVVLLEVGVESLIRGILAIGARLAGDDDDVLAVVAAVEVQGRLRVGGQVANLPRGWLAED